MTFYNYNFRQFCRNVILVSRCSGTLLIRFFFVSLSIVFYVIGLTCDLVSIDFSKPTPCHYDIIRDPS